MALIKVYRENAEILQFPIQKKLVSLGRSPKCDLVLPDKEVSSLHANILTVNDRYRLIDLDSTNGTFVRGEKIHEHVLEDKDEARIGVFRLVFLAGGDLDRTAVTFIEKDYIRESHALLGEIKQTHLTAVLASGERGEAGKVLTQKLEVLDKSLVHAGKAHGQLKRLFNLAEAINSAKGLDTILRLILRNAIEATGMERGAVVLYDEENRLRPILGEGLGKDLESAISFSVVEKTVQSGSPVVLAEEKEFSELKEARSIITHGIKATICVPLKSRSDKILGVLYLDSRFPDMDRANTSPEFLSLFSIFAATAIQTRQLAEKEKSASTELAAAREREKYERELKQLEQENRRLAEKAASPGIKNLLGVSPPMEALYATVRKVAAAEVSVLLTGETGTGKSLIARSIHDLSARKEREFVTIDCASIPSELLESELFGYEKGAFTGAGAQKKGRVESAEGGTLFLDEIGDMSLKLQAKMLRFLQERCFERVGGTKTLSIDVRVITATHKDLKAAVADKSFREDLYYRLSTVTLNVPPLKERGEDILILANAFLDEIRAQSRLNIKGFAPEAKNIIFRYPWEGNVRQLKNVVQRAAIMTQEEFIGPGDLGLEPLLAEKTPTLKDAREEVDKRLIRIQLLAQKGNLSRVAGLLDVDRSTLRELMKRYGLESPKGEK